MGSEDVTKPRLSDEEALKLFKERMAVSDPVVESYEDKWARLDRVYHGETKDPKKQEDNGKSRLRIPWAWQQIETIIPRIMDPSPKFGFMPVEPTDAKKSIVWNRLTRKQLDMDRFVTRQRSWIEDGCVKGLAVSKTIWKQTKKEALVRPPRSLSDKLLGRSPEMKREQRVVENRPTIKYIPPEDFRWDPTAIRDEDLEWGADRSWRTMAYLEKMQRAGVYKNVKEVKAAVQDASNRRSVRETPKEAQARRQGKYAIWEMHDREGNLIAVCNGVLIRNIQSPFAHLDLPYSTFRSQPSNHSLVGVSEVEKIEHIQQAIWTLDNQRIDAISLTLNPVFKVDPTIRGWKNLTFRPGLKIPATRGQEFEQIRIDANAAPSWGLTEAYIGAVQQMTGANPIMFGADPSTFGINQETATGASIMQEEGNKRMAMKKLEFRLFEARIAKLMLQLNHQYLSDFELFRIVGDDGLKTDRPSVEEIPMFLDVIPEGMSESLSKSVERNSMIEVMNLLGPLHMMPMHDGTAVSIQKIIERIVSNYDIDVGDVFIPQEYMTPPSMPGVPEGGANIEPSVEDEVHNMNEVMNQ